MERKLQTLAFLAVATASFPGISLVGGFTFTLEKTECFVETLQGPLNVMLSYVVTKLHPRGYGENEDQNSLVNVEIRSPDDIHVAGIREKSEGEIYFYTHAGGEYKACFTNLGPSRLVLSVEIMEYYAYKAQKSGTMAVTGGEVDSLQQELRRLQDDVAHAHHDIWYSFFLAQHHIEIDRTLGKRLVVKAVSQGVLLLVCSVAQVVILRILFERKGHGRRGKV